MNEKSTRQSAGCFRVIQPPPVGVRGRPRRIVAACSLDQLVKLYDKFPVKCNRILSREQGENLINNCKKTLDLLEKLW